MTRCQQYDNDWELLLLGALDEGEAAAMRAHVESGCPTCRSRWIQATQALAAIGSTLEPVDPPQEVETRLQQKLHEAKSGAPRAEAAALRREPPSAWRHAWAVAALVLFAAGIVLARQYLELRRDLADTRRQLASAVEARPAGDMQPPNQVPDASPPAPIQPPSSPDRREPPAASQDAAQRDRERLRLEERLAQSEAGRLSAEAEAARLTAALVEAQRLAAAQSVPAPSPVPSSSDDQRQRVAALEQTVGQLTSQVRRLEAEARRQSDLTREYASALQAAVDDRATRVMLRPVDAAAGKATAGATVTADGRVLLVARGLPTLPADKCYQLWVIRRDNPAIVSGGVLTVSVQGQSVHTVRVEGVPGQITGLAVTDEPLGGSVQSRGRKLLFGSVN